MLIAGIVLLALGALGVVLAHRSRSRLHAMITAETIPVSELEEHRRTLAELDPSGGFRKVCEVVGDAAVGPHGPLRSEYTGTECVWFRHRIDRRYRVTERDSEGEWRTSERTQIVHDVTSSQGYALADGTGLIGVDPSGVAPDRPECAGGGFDTSGAAGSLGLLGMLGAGGQDTLGFEHTEWVIRPGQRLYVLGEVHDRIGPLVIGRPEGGADFVISTRSEDELRADRARSQRWQAWGGAAAGVAGAVLVVLGLVL